VGGRGRPPRVSDPAGALSYFHVSVEETDLVIGVPKDRFSERLAAETTREVEALRRRLELYLKDDPAFLTALEPRPPLPGAPPIVRMMCEAGERVGVGPMAAVAGAVAELVGRRLLARCGEVIVENGGDIFLASRTTRRVGIHAGGSPFSGRIALAIDPQETPIGVCTSSGTVGHSLSLGNADAVVVTADSVALADAAATAAANAVHGDADLERAVALALNVRGVRGAVAIRGDRLAAKGEVRLAPC